MERILKILGRDKVARLLDQVSGDFGLPLALLDREGRLVAAAAPAAPDGSGRGPGDAGVPISFSGEKAGSLVPGPGGESFPEAVQRAASSLENSLQLEAENLDLSAEVVRLYQEQSLIYALSARLGSEMDIDTICSRILEEGDRILAVRHLCVMLLESPSGDLFTRAGRSHDGPSIDFRADSKGGLLGPIFAGGVPVTICDIGDEGRKIFPFPVRSVLCAPLVTDGRGIGMVVACDKISREEFWSQELKLMAVFAQEAAAAIRKAQLYEEISDLFVQTVEALASAIDAKDPYTYGHSNRVARVSVAICEELGMSRKEIRQVELAAILHDIGKIGTPEKILTKPGRLTRAEEETIHEHPGRGATILSRIGEFRDVTTWIRHHHEWYDGKGYPDHIVADEIPLQARILSVADAFDAMTSDRPYRKGMPAGEALRIMAEFAGTQFDPGVLQTFRALYDGGRLPPLK